MTEPASFVVEPEPPEAASILGTNATAVRVFAEDLATHGETLGLLGPREYPRLWSRHILNCAVIAPLFDGDSTVADVGSGAGLPGLVLAALRPDIEWHLIESMSRRVNWLRDESDRLALTNVVVHQERAEDMAGSSAFDSVTARAVSALRTLIPVCAPLVRAGGRLVLIKGKSVAGEIDAARKQIRAAGLSEPMVREVGVDVLADPTTVLVATVKG